LPAVFIAANAADIKKRGGKMAFEDQIIIVMYIMLGAVAAMLYALRRIFLLEKRILSLEKLILDLDKKLAAKFGKKR